MILRKPYALFIKYFRLLHMVMAVLILLLLFRTYSVYNFFVSYIKDYQVAMVNFKASNLINMYSFFLAMLIIIVTVILLSVMIYKKKPKFVYIYNILVYVLTIILFGFCFQTLSNISGIVLDVRVTKAYRDFALMAVIAQAISFILIAVRATGFDLKKFDFASDLQQLDISDKDSEEIEVALELDGNKVGRNVRNKLRNIRYIYFEHKFLINTIVAILVIILAFYIFFTYGLYRANYKQGVSFSASGNSINVTDSYVTNLDSQGTPITNSDKVAVIVKFDISGAKTLNTGTITLRIGKLSFSHNNDIVKKLDDLGTPYTNQQLTNEFESYILGFEIPKSLENSEMQLKINDNISYVRGEVGAKNIFVKLNPEDVDKANALEEAKLGQPLTFYNSVLKGTSIEIDSYDISNKFKSEYTFCYGKNKCFNSYEYLTPTATGNYDKTLLKFTGSLNLDDNLNLSDLNNFTGFLNKFGTLNYEVDGQWKSNKIDSKQIKPKVSNGNGAYYIEVNKEVEKASQIYISFKIRGDTYKYILK